MAKTPLNSEEIAIAGALKRAFERRKLEEGLTQEAFGQEVSASQALVWKWMNGRERVSLDKAAPVAHALGFDDPAQISLQYRENAQRFGASAGVQDGGSVDRALLERVNALETVLMAIIGATAGHRPAEGRDLADALRTMTTPAARKLPFVQHMLEVLDPSGGVQSQPRGRSGRARR